jgi:hypothetical protein
MGRMQAGPFLEAALPMSSSENASGNKAPLVLFPQLRGVKAFVEIDCDLSTTDLKSNKNPIACRVTTLLFLRSFVFQTSDYRVIV